MPVFAICDEGSELDRVLRKVRAGKSIDSWDSQQMIGEMQEFIESLKNTSHQLIYLDNKNTILKEFDVDQFISRLP